MSQLLVRVYWNLHRHLWSILTMPGRRVLSRREQLVLDRLIFVVSEAGRQRVLRERRRNVHAFASGLLSGDTALDAQAGPLVAVTYNPYKGPTFVSRLDRRRVLGGERALLTFELQGGIRVPQLLVQGPLYGE